MTGYYQQSYDYEMPSLTFISSPEQMKKPVSSSDLGSAYLFLKHQPECACGKEFRASGKDTALQNVAKHLQYKKYANCQPTVKELVYTVPEFVTVSQIFGTEANELRNSELRKRIDKARRYEELKHTYSSPIPFERQIDYDSNWDGVRMRMRGIVYDGETETFWSTNKGEQKFPPTVPTVNDGYQISSNINLKGTVTKKTTIRDVKSKKSGQEFEVCDATIQDENGDEIAVTLWNDQCKKVAVGDKITITNAQTDDQGRWGFKLKLFKNASKIIVEKSEVTAN